MKQGKAAAAGGTPGSVAGLGAGWAGWVTCGLRRRRGDIFVDGGAARETLAREGQWRGQGFQGKGKKGKPAVVEVTEADFNMSLQTLAPSLSMDELTRYEELGGCGRWAKGDCISAGNDDTPTRRRRLGIL